MNADGVSARSVRAGAGWAGEGGVGAGAGGTGGAGPSGGAVPGRGAGGAGTQIPPPARTSMSSIPTHSSWPVAFVVITRSCTSGRLSAAAGSTAATGVTRVAAPGPVVASATNAPGTAAKAPESPTRYCRATGCTASAFDDRSTSRSRYRTATRVCPRVSSEITRCGAAAVAEPCRATTGSASSNSETPAARPTAAGSRSFAFTSLGVREPSAVTLRGSVPAAAVKRSPRWPTTAAAPDQSSSRVISPVWLHACENGSAIAAAAWSARKSMFGKGGGRVFSPPGSDSVRSVDRVQAAGGVVMRDGLVAVVHRPRYDDWSLPKGKLDPGESFEDAALREVEEEAGLRCRLVRELPAVEYEVRGRPKLVRYWAMEVVDDLGFVPNDEVDEIRWVEPPEALALLTYDRDREPVLAL